MGPARSPDTTPVLARMGITTMLGLELPPSIQKSGLGVRERGRRSRERLGIGRIGDHRQRLC
eukprot:1129999-Alexandrium_andersonii.AAC.1